MVLLAYAISLLVGEAIRDVQYAQVAPEAVDLLTVPKVGKRSRWFLFSGPFLLLKQRYRLNGRILRRIVSSVLQVFSHLVFDHVRTLVRSSGKRDLTFLMRPCMMELTYPTNEMEPKLCQLTR
jgi:hypothetical protein